MSKYIKTFDTLQEYQEYSGSTAFTSPNVSYVKANDTTYYDNNEIKHYTEQTWLKTIDESEYTATTFSLVPAIKEVEIPSSVTTIGTNTFQGCTSLTSVTIPNSVTSIGNQAFLACSSLANITIPSSVTSIGNYVFQGCTSLTSITVDASNTVYDSRDNCNAIIHSATNKLIIGCKTTVIPNTVTSIENRAFHGYSSLTSITIPSSVTSIGDAAFYYCTSLASVTVEATTPPTLGLSAFLSTNNCPIYVPSESVDAYKAATNWSTYADRIQAIS